MLFPIEAQIKPINNLYASANSERGVLKVMRYTLVMRIYSYTLCYFSGSQKDNKFAKETKNIQ